MAAPETSFLRTPNACFDDVPDFPYRPNYLLNGNMRMAYIDELSPGASIEAREVFLLLHGQPTWSFLYRKMIPIFLSQVGNSKRASRHVVAPDLFGFGRSDKPKQEAAYTFDFHREALLYLVRTLDLRNVTLVVQDWGGILGLTLPLDLPGRVKRLIVMNTTLGTGAKPTQGFVDWRSFCNREPDMQIGKLVGRGAKHLSPVELAAYDAPFVSADYKAGVRSFPNLVPVAADMPGVDVSRRALQMYGDESTVFGSNDVFVACGMRDPVLGPPVMRVLATMFRHGCMFMEVAEAGHFVQEWGAAVARKALEAFEKQDVVEGVTRVRSPSKPSKL